MQTIGIKALKNKLSEYVRAAAAGETVLVTDRGRVVAELVPPRVREDASLAEQKLGQLIRGGVLIPATVPPGARLPPRRPVARLAEVCAHSTKTAPTVDLSRSPVVLARLFAEDHSPPDCFWSQTFVSSRLLEFEVFNRVHSRGAATSDVVHARHFVDRVSLLELSSRALARALRPFPLPVRTLDALHLATMDFLRVEGQTLELATLRPAPCRSGEDAWLSARRGLAVAHATALPHRRR